MHRRVLLDLRGPEPGPSLVVVAALHGNEPAGIDALAALGERLRSGGGLLRGRIVGLVGNVRAAAVGRRFLDEDLNRIWDAPSDPIVATREERERADLVRALNGVRHTADDVHVIDIHTTSGRGPAFSIVPLSAWGKAAADALPIPRVTGIFHSLRGTFGGWLEREGIPNITIESGSHRDPESGDRAEAVLRVLAERLGLADPGCLDADGARSFLREHVRGLPSNLHVRYRHGITPDDDFRMLPGFRNIQEIREDQPLARDREGTIHAPSGGWLLLPLYQLQGEDGFLIAEAIEEGAPALSAPGFSLPERSAPKPMRGVARSALAP